MKIKCSQNLMRLARLFESKHSLFISGESVANGFLNNRRGEITLSSFLTAEEIFSLVENTEFIVKIKSAKEGVVEIRCDKESFTHLTFKSQSRDLSAAIVDDAKTKDFTINAMYYKVLTGEIIDPLDGIKSIKVKSLKCCDNENCFTDGGNILKAILLACEFGFELSEELVASAQKNVKAIRQVGGEKKFYYLKSLLSLEQEKMIRALTYLSKLDLFKFMVGVKGYNLKPGIENFRLVKTSDEKLKMLAFYIDYFNYLNAQKKLPLKQFISCVLRDCLKCNMFEQRKTLQIMSGYLSYDEENLSFYIANNIFNIDTLIALYSVCDSEKAEAITKGLEVLKNNKAPLSLNQLKISVKEIKEICGDGVNINSIHKRLLCDCILNPSLNAKEKLIKQVIKYM